jgi:hypothetical protein
MALRSFVDVLSMNALVFEQTKLSSMILIVINRNKPLTQHSHLVLAHPK